MLSRVAQRKSPVTGDTFPALSKDYRKEKVEDGFDGVPDLERSGDMLDALDYRVTSEGIEFGVFGADALKADGHNNLSGESLLPQRRFIPGEGEGFVSAIEREVNKIIADSIGDATEPDASTLGSITTKAALYDYLIPIFGLGTRTETRMAVLRSDRWTRILTRLGLIEKL